MTTKLTVALWKWKNGNVKGMCKRKKGKGKMSFPISSSKQTRKMGNEFSHFPFSSHFHESKHALYIAMYWILKEIMIWLKFYFHVKICVFWFDLMDWIESGSEAKIRFAIHDHIQFPNSCSSLTPPKSPQQILKISSHINHPFIICH